MSTETPAVEWLILSNGAPDEPDSSDIDALFDTPGPKSFVYPFLRKMGVPAFNRTTIKDVEVDGERIVDFDEGAVGSGLKIREVVNLETTDIPVFSCWQSYGLKDVGLCWVFSIEYAGIFGHTAFRHHQLRVWFATPEAREVFTSEWRAVYAREPAFEPATEPLSRSFRCIPHQADS